MSQADQSASRRSTAIRTSKNTAMLLAGTLTRMIASFAFVIYCADQMGVEGFGKYSIAIHFFELFLSLTATAAGILLTRDLARWPRHAQQLFTSAVLLVLLLWMLAPACLWCVGASFNYSADTRAALLISSLALIPAAVCSIAEAAFVAKERAEYVTLGTAIESIGRIVLSVCVLAMGYGLLALVGVLFFVRAAMLIAYLRGLSKVGLLGWSFHPRRTRRFFARWRVFAGENWMATIYTSLDIIVLSWITGEVAAGLYSAAWKIVRLGSVFAKSYTTAIFPVMSRMYSQSRESFSQLHQHSIRVMCVIALPAIAFISVVPDRVIGLLFKEEFSEASAVLQVLIWVLLIEFLNPFLSHILFAQGKQRQSMHVAGISLAVNSIATYLLVTQFGAVGAALGTVLGGLVATVFYTVFAMNKTEILGSVLAGLRVLAAACGLAAAISFIPEASWPTLIALSAIVYGSLLFIVGAVRIEDIQFFRTTFLAKAAS